MTRSTQQNRLGGGVFWCGLLLLGCSFAEAQVTQEGDRTVFRTGSGEVLLTSEVALQVPSAEFVPELRLELGFSTAESDAVGVFFDSFSVTLERADGQATAVLLTLDRTGVLWAPTTRLGVAVDPMDLGYAAVTFPSLDPVYELSWAFSVSYRLPEDFLGTGATVYVDLFDNLNAADSLGYVRDVQIANRGVTDPALVSLESSASAGGPFAVESSVEVDLEAKTLRLPEGGARRFFILNSPVRTRVVGLTRAAQTDALHYVFDPQEFVLEVASSLNGPWAEPAMTVYRSGEERVEVPLELGFGFLRLRTEAEARILSVTEEGGVLVLRYRVEADAPRVLSSAQPTGPYAYENGVQIDKIARMAFVRRGGATRFFRLRSDHDLRISSVRREGQEIVIVFE